MKAILSVFILMLPVAGLFSQTTVSGRVTNQKDEPIPGANIFLLDTYDGTTSDLEGNFEFSTDENGSKILIVKFVGFADWTHEVNLLGEMVMVQVTLSEAVNHLQAVTITAGSFTASDESRRTIFKAQDIATTAGATADIAGALNTLPGTQKVGETGRLFVRGGDGHEARTFIDGMLVLDAYGAAAPNTPSRGRFLPFMFKGTSFSTGGYSAEYGQALSSALVLDSKDQAEMNRTDIGLLSVGGDVTHTQVWDKASLAGKIQYTNIRPYFGLINQEVDWITPPASIEGSGVFRHKTGKNGIIKVYGNFNHTNFSLLHHDIDNSAITNPYDLTNNYRYINTAYKGSLGKRWLVRGGISYTYHKNDIMAEKTGITDRETGVHVKFAAEGSVGNFIEVKTGAEVIGREHDFITTAQGLQNAFAFREVITSSFLEGDILASANFMMRAGIRAEHNNLSGEISADPRLSLAYKAGANGSISLAYGKFRQSSANTFLRNDPSLKPEKAGHYIASYQLIENNRTFRAEAYYKSYRDLVKFHNGNESLLTNNGNGYAKGIEFFWRDNQTFKNTDYWISYSWLDTKRNYLHFPNAAVPAFASAHNFSFVCKYFFTKLKTQFGATYSFTSGRPYYNPNNTKFHQDKTPNYHDLSVNLAYLPRPFLILFLSATNLTGNDNIFGYEFGKQQNENGLFTGRAIRQPAKHFLFLGVFITLSKNKIMNQMPVL